MFTTFLQILELRKFGIYIIISQNKDKDEINDMFAK